MKKNIILFLILIYVFLIRVFFIDLSFERDEGHYAYIAWQLCQKKILYTQVLDDKPPLIFFLYTLPVAIFGNRVEGIRFLSAIFVVLSCFFIYSLTKEIYDKNTAILACFLYGFASNFILLQGILANTEVFLNLFLILAIYFFLRFKNLILSGVFTGLGILTKLVGITHILLFLALFSFLYFRYKNLKSQIKNFLTFTLGISLVFLVISIYFLMNHNLKEAVLQGFIIPVISGIFSRHLGEIGLIKAFSLQFKKIATEGLIFWLYSVAGLPLLITHRQNEKYILLFLWFITSCIGVCLGKWFYPHYFIQLLPACTIITAYIIYKIFKIKEQRSFFISLTVLLFIVMLQKELRLYFISKEAIIKEIYGEFHGSYFVNAKEVALYIKKHSKPSDYVYIWGMEPEVYFYAKRSSPVRFSFHTLVLEREILSQRGIWGIKDLTSEIKKNLQEKIPKFIILSDVLYKDSKICNFLKEFIDKNYKFINYIPGYKVYIISSLFDKF